MREATGRLVDDGDAVKAFIATNELVFGIWQDADQPHGVGVLCIKGKADLAQVFATGEPAQLKMTTIPCREAAEAHAMRVMFGDREH